MFIPGKETHTRDGNTVRTGLVAGRVNKDGELRYTQSGKAVASVSVPAFERQDGTTAWLTVKAWGFTAQILSAARKGDHIFAVGVLSEREYNGKVYTDLTADYVAVQPAGDGNSTPRVDNTPSGFSDCSREEEELPF